MGGGVWCVCMCVCVWMCGGEVGGWVGGCVGWEVCVWGACTSHLLLFSHSSAETSNTRSTPNSNTSTITTTTTINKPATHQPTHPHSPYPPRRGACGIGGGTGSMCSCRRIAPRSGTGPRASPRLAAPLPFLCCVVCVWAVCVFRGVCMYVDEANRWVRIRTGQLAWFGLRWLVIRA
jgi:hypothetical protein